MSFFILKKIKLEIYTEILIFIKSSLTFGIELKIATL